MSSSLQSRLLQFAILLAIIAVIITASISVVKAYLEERETTGTLLTEYIHQRGQLEEQLFVQVEKAQSSAETLYYKHVEHLTDARVDDLFEQYFILQDDGTRRSIDSLFKGTYIEGHGPVHGIAVYISGRFPMTPERKRTLVSAFLAITDLAPSYENSLESLWFTTPYSDLIIFAPQREDGLIYYRKEAGPDFDITEAAFFHTSSVEKNPTGRTQCTPLSRLMYIETGEALTTGCQTPLRTKGEQIGIWGTTLPLGPVFRESLRDIPLEGADMFFLSDDGELIAHRDITLNTQVTRDDVAEIETRLDTPSLMSRIVSSDGQSGIVYAGGPLFDDMNFVYRLGVPDWYLVVRISHHSLWMKSLGEVLPSFLASLTIVLLCIACFFYMIRREGIVPIKALSHRFNLENSRKSVPDVDCVIDRIRSRPDELGELARVLTDYKHQTDHHLDELETQIAQRTQELRAANEAKSRFLATMSHELRTPMNGIMGTAGALQRTDLTEQQREMSDLILKSADVLERQLTDVLDISKIEAGRLELSPAPFNLAETIESTCELYAMSAREKGLDFDVEIAPSCEGYFMGDAVRLRQIVGNITSNAIKFTEDGHISIFVDTTGQYGNRTDFEIRIEDTGIGISPKALKKIFSPFSQADEGTYRRFGGTGLGLSICKSLIELMGGSISVETTEGEGATFICKVGFVRCQSRDVDSEMPEDLKIDAEKPVQRILIAEDHQVNQRVIQLILEPLGHSLFTVENGLEAVEAIKATEFDLILMDIQMPEMDGLEATRRIRELEKQTGRTSSMIVMLSANATEHDCENSLQAGADIHLAKPITPSRLINAISALIRNRHLEDESRKSASL